MNLVKNKTHSVRINEKVLELLLELGLRPQDIVDKIIEEKGLEIKAMERLLSENKKVG